MLSKNETEKFGAMKAAFLDRDGVINIDTGYVCTQEDFVWMPGVVEAIEHLIQNGYEVFIVTNQSGIGRGLYSESKYLKFQTWIESELRGQGANVIRTLYCPHHPVEGQGIYKVECECRKPTPGMINEVLEDGRYDRSQCILIGDKESDLAAARAAGIAGFLFDGGNLFEFVRYF